jgi:hypothetical protein
MRKYENADIAACLGAVLEINTENYKSDFKYDLEMFAEAARLPDGENNRLVWLSRRSGTECFHERDIYLIESQAHNSWTYYAGAMSGTMSDTVRAYAVEVNGMENGRIKGDLYELDYPAHVGHVRKNALHVTDVSVRYADGEELHMPYKEWDGMRERLYMQHGEIKHCRPTVFKAGIRSRNPGINRQTAPQKAAAISNNTEENTMSYNNNAISASDPRAVEKLTEKLQKCGELQEVMKGVNAYYRRNGTCQGAPGITETEAAKLDNKVANGYSWETQPFRDYELSYNNREIRRLKTRIEEITRNREVGFAGWEFEGGRAETNTELNRLQLFFDEKPDEQQRDALKINGFKWAPSQSAWQRQLNDNAIYAANRLNFLRPADGRTVREHQPKAPVREAGARQIGIYCSQAADVPGRQPLL